MYNGYITRRRRKERKKETKEELVCDCGYKRREKKGFFVLFCFGFNVVCFWREMEE